MLYKYVTISFEFSLIRRYTLEVKTSWPTNLRTLIKKKRRGSHNFWQLSLVITTNFQKKVVVQIRTFPYINTKYFLQNHTITIIIAY